VRARVASGELGIGALLADLTPQQVRDEALDLMTEAGLAGEPMRDDNPLSVHEAIAEVTRRVGVIAKDKQTTGGERFSFRGIDDALAALHPLLGDVGLVLMPGEVVREQFDTRTTAKGGTLNVARLLVRYRFIGPDGTTTTGEAWGEAGDSGDKATQKAHSQSYKTLVFQTFSIPTQQSVADEPDAVHEVAVPFSDAQRARAGAAWQAARQATGMPALVAVREQAAGEGLLDCPVATDREGRVLGLLLDERRREVARAVAEQAPA
jgi:hypothetical protein